MEKINLIQALRYELNELNTQKNIRLENIKELDKKYKINVNQSNELNVELGNVKSEFKEKKIEKGMIFTGPVGIILAVIIFFACNHYLIPTGNFDYISSLFISLFGASSIFVALSYYIASNDKFDILFGKVFPKLKLYYDKIELLRNNFNKTIDEIDNILEQKTTINSLINSIDEKMKEKKQELDGLTNDYFDSIENNHLVDKNDNIYITQENKGKTRVRTPKNK